VSTGQACRHQSQIRVVKPEAIDICPACVAAGDRWVHLRVCLSCGHVGCCDNSKNQHARRHFEETGHPVIQSLELGEAWRYCYVDDAFIGEGLPFSGSIRREAKAG
jgi:CPA2 family monovalent cation:H+ antiporter-2